MKRGLLAGTAIALALFGGIWWLARRPQASAATVSEVERPLFQVTPQGLGAVIQVNPPGPLRNISWSRPLSGGRTVCLVSTQADQHLIGVFEDGALLRTFPLPGSVESALLRKASLLDAAFSVSSLYLLLGDEDHPRDPALLLNLDSASGALRAFHRAPARHLALAGDDLLLYGADLPLVRLTFRAGKAEATTLDLPFEIRSPQAFLPLGAKALLVAHAGGLSALSSEGVWRHTPLPRPSALSFPQAHAVLASAGGRALWWQPAPGQLFQVDKAGGILREMDLAQAGGTAEGVAQDSALLSLLGADAGGQLWFGLAVPDLHASAATGTDNAQGSAGSQPQGLASEARAALEIRLKGPMDRLFRLGKDGEVLVAFSWSDRWNALQAPTGISKPQGAEGFTPEAEAFLLGEGLYRWWLPLQALTR